jgi:hypothetical protein
MSSTGVAPPAWLSARCGTTRQSASPRTSFASEKPAPPGSCLSGRARPRWRTEAHQKRLPHVVAARQARQRERLATDPIYQLNQRVRCRVHHALKHVGLTKNRKSWVDLVGYSAADLKRHLERQFTKGMSWDNAGEWHIEHITALVRFSYTSVDDPEFRAAWALSNLRPLWGPENKSKGSKRTHLL